MPALELLLVLGGAVTAGCYSSTAPGHDDAAVDVSADDGGEDLRHDPVVDPRPDPVPDPIVDPVAEEVPCAHPGETIEEILLDCVPDDQDRDQFLNCINALHESWRIGLAEVFAYDCCEHILDRLIFCLAWRCDDPSLQGEFDPEEFFDNCSNAIYLGVRFE